ncbi:MAG: electron transfer flavoprotein subunit alpha/FixB family protein [Candidatus Gastranaerophilales bacterium]|nr:electron transfer flavoprotein subunit alpha/FixB family protein [Candidatus Gastranaerophilales bacterium]
MKVSIFAQLNKDNRLEDVSLELLGAANQLAQKLDDREVGVLLLHNGGDCSHLISQLEQGGADKVYLIQNEKLAEYNALYFQKAVLEFVEKKQPEIFLIGATALGRDLAPRVAAALNTGLTADCTSLDINEQGKLAATRPTFGGELMATILCRNLPQMATVRPKVFKKPKPVFDKKAQVEEIQVDFSDIHSKINVLDFVQKALECASIEEAEIIVAGGKGLKNKENFVFIEKLAHNLGGKAAASRGIVDLGWCDHSIQIGQTGKTVSPKIYIACGISGAIQHLEGMKTSEKIIAINKDPNAPVFKIADYCIVGDAIEILPVLIEKSEKK